MSCHNHHDILSIIGYANKVISQGNYCIDQQISFMSTCFSYQPWWWDIKVLIESGQSIQVFRRNAKKIQKEKKTQQHINVFSKRVRVPKCNSQGPEKTILFVFECSPNRQALKVLPHKKITKEKALLCFSTDIILSFLQNPQLLLPLQLEML